MRLLPRTAAADRASISVSTLKRLEADNKFPGKVQVTPGRVGYVESEVDDFITQLIAERDRSGNKTGPTIDKNTGDAIGVPTPQNCKDPSP